MMPKGSLLVFSDDWGRHPSSCQHLIAQLADRYHVVWVNTIGTRTPRLDWSTARRGWEKAGHWFKRRTTDSPDGRVHVTSPIMWPWLSKGRDRWLNRLLLSRQLNARLPDLPRPIIAITTLPIVADLVGELSVDRWVYYCVDDFSKWPGLDQTALAELEEQLVSKVDAVVAVSVPLVQRMRQFGRASTLLTHGVDVPFWRIAQGNDIAADRFLDRYEPPYVLFWGVVDQRMDIEWLEMLSARLDCGTVLLVGPQDQPDPRIHRLGNLHLLGPVPFELLPRLAGRASVLIMPYADLPVTRAMQPLKLKEYLATGRPVVVRRLPAIREWTDCLDSVESADGFADSVMERLACGVPQSQQAARLRLSGESWSSKAGQLEKILLADIRTADVAACGLDIAEMSATCENA